MDFILILIFALLVTFHAQFAVTQQTLNAPAVQMQQLMAHLLCSISPLEQLYAINIVLKANTLI
jgi:hypothetical protein